MKTRSSPSWSAYESSANMPRAATVLGVVAIRPNTLNVARDKKNNDTQKFIREALHAWRAKARCNVVPAERLHDLFEELNFSPTEKQINEMLQTAKLFARRGSSLDGRSKHMNGLTFGEFCVLAADLKRFRTQYLTQCHDKKSSLPTGQPNVPNEKKNVQNGRKSAISSQPQPTVVFDVNAPEVFLGGSCNPTTWRADVAIPELDKLGISFYNPQVSDWTPDLIELEHRAKEKARVLFFVMDSETRASAGAIEAAHIAGQNSRHLVLVLHPYKPDQSILNEPISPQEFLDLKRNQELLRELVIRRGLPVLDSIPSGLQRTRAILAGSLGRSAPYNIASRLISVRRAFDHVSGRTLDDKITIAQCQKGLTYLGYAQNLLSANNLIGIIETHRASEALEKNEKTSVSPVTKSTKANTELSITFDEFCMLTSYLVILQQEIYDSGCISPIKGTNLPPPPIFLTNTPEWIGNQNTQNDGMNMTINSTYTKQIFRTSSCKSVPDDRFNNSSELYRNRDSGTSSPQPHETRSATKTAHIDKKTKISFHVELMANEQEEESDSNDSVFSSGSSIDSNIGESHTNGLEISDIYLGGSCMLRTSWRKEIAIPMLHQKCITYQLPMLHESICASLSHRCAHEQNGHIIKNEPSGSLCTVLKKRNKKLNKFKLKNPMSEIEDKIYHDIENTSESISPTAPHKTMFNPAILDACRVLLFVITNETRSLAPMTLAAHYIGLGYNVVLCVQMLPEFCVIGTDRLTPAAIKDYNRGRSYLIDLAKRQGVPVFSDLKQTIECAIEKAKTSNSRNSI